MHFSRGLCGFLAFLLAGLLPAAAEISGSPHPGAQVPGTYRAVVTRTNQLDYLLYLPKGYDSDAAKTWPLVLFLHGAGERGNDLQKVAVHGPPKMAAAGTEFPFLLVSPQCPEGQVWDDRVLIGLLDELQARYRVDPRRVYVTGLSMGGYGTWALAQRHPQRFAAVAPICGGGERIRALLPAQQQALKTLGVWAFHGAKDNVVVLAESERMVEAFRKAGVSDIQLTVYPEAGHDSWTQAYNEPEFFNWLLKHQR
ncbi:MAG: prolyl oligopeptidase family serine peptidase [Verrucomicrobia bacterium]|nr:prolyl oligopeptidase family serine peptidase [Verrucomicrobiota bacterium]